jgi:D-alanyl-lipoteichoic acid acyltransferase DltB (MBOAT superfamily)
MVDVELGIRPVRMNENRKTEPQAADAGNSGAPPAPSPGFSSSFSLIPSLMMAGGVAIAALALGLDLTGFGGAPGIGPGQVRAALAGGLLTVLGAILDAALGAHRLRAWLATQFPDRSSVLRFLAIVVQLSLLVLVMRQYQIENRAFFHNILLLALFGFLIHHFLPASWRMPFFLLLSLAGISGVLGPANAAWVVVAGLVLIAVCHLPVAFRMRVLMLLAVAAALAAMRADWLKTPFPSAVWPILGSMFMFRLIVFLYDFKHQKDRAPWSQTLSYFFLLPNVVFPLFPVVDYKTFRRTHYDAPWPDIYQRGIHWMFRGLTHLLLYRVVNYYVMLAPEEVAGWGDLLRFLVSNFLLYLRVSGQFHLIIGLLHLFGFHLPETNNLYCFSSSFTDFWRRINIYWKDFMMKVFYYPAYFALQKRGATLALVLATVFVFVVTWFLHAYQWFWLRGSFLLTATDVLFWTILGALMVANTLYEAKFGRKRTLGKAVVTSKDLALRGLRTAGTFATIIVLWSLWTSPSVAEWFALFSFAGPAAPPAGAVAPPDAMLLALVAAMAVAGASGPAAGPFAQLARWMRTPLVLSLLLATLYFVASPTAFSRLQGAARDVVGTLRAPRISQREANLLRRGYYEDLIGVNSFNNQLWNLFSRRRGEPLIQETEAGRRTGDFLNLELIPSTNIVFRGQPYSVNRWGMRDRDYEQLPPPRTLRLAVLGSSQVNGWGVADRDVFDVLLEERLNRDAAQPRFEVLNFAVPAYTALQQILVVEQRVGLFRPNAVLYVAHPNDMHMAANQLIAQWINGTAIPFPELSGLLARAGISRQTPLSDGQRRLKPFREEMITWAYRRLVASCREHNMLPVWVYLPMEPGNSWPADEAEALPRIAASAGFLVLDLRDVYSGHDVTSLQIAEWDKHPNRRGHQLIADRLFDALARHPELFAQEQAPPGGR